MSISKWRKLIERGLYLFVVPLVLLLILGVQYIIQANAAIHGKYAYDFMFAANSIPIPWYMKTEDIFIKYAIVYGSSLILLTIGYLIVLIKNIKSMQWIIGILAILVLCYEYSMVLAAMP